MTAPLRPGGLPGPPGPPGKHVGGGGGGAEGGGGGAGGRGGDGGGGGVARPRRPKPGGARRERGAAMHATVGGRRGTRGVWGACEGQGAHPDRKSVV